MKYISVLFFVFVIAVIFLADHGSLPHSIRALYDFPNGDKLGHFILFGLFDFVLTRALFASFPSRPRGGLALAVGLTLALFIAAEEWSQKFFSTRTFDLLDLLAGYAGVTTFSLLAICWRSHK
jgi:polysaccharide biosynthesis protein VpsQ